jgi:hypothetical protein
MLVELILAVIGLVVIATILMTVVPPHDRL